MVKKIIRNRFLHANKYQKPIILAGFVPMAVMCVSLAVMVKRLHSEALIYVLYGTKNEMITVFRSDWVLDSSSFMVNIFDFYGLGFLFVKLCCWSI